MHQPHVLPPRFAFSRAAILLTALALVTATVACSRFVPNPTMSKDRTAPLTPPPTDPAPNPPLAAIQVHRTLRTTLDHRTGCSGDYCVEWDISLTHPAPVPLLVAQRYQSLAQIHHGTSDVTASAAYTEIVGFIPAGQTRPIIAGTPDALAALLEYTRENPAEPMRLPTRAELQNFAETQVTRANPEDRPNRADFYAAAALAFDADNAVDDAWYFPGTQIETAGHAAITGRLMLYQATPELLEALTAWDTTGGQEHFTFGTMDISLTDFTQLFSVAPPTPEMGPGGSGDCLSRDDHDDTPATSLEQFPELGHESPARRLTVTWNGCDKPALQMQP